MTTPDRKSLRGAVLAEDRRTERFFRELLDSLGFDKRRFRFRTAPSGEGDAKTWVKAQYPDEVALLRRKNFQRLALVAVRDGDSLGVAGSKADLDAALSRPRESGERIATPVPTWSIETWLLALLETASLELTESATFKHEFEQRYRGRAEGRALRDAARRWAAATDPEPPSLVDGRSELARLDR